MTRRHQQAIMDEDDLGLSDEYRGTRLFTNTPFDAHRAGNPPLPVYQGLQPYYGIHRRKATGAISGDVYASPVEDGR